MRLLIGLLAVFLQMSCHTTVTPLYQNELYKLEHKSLAPLKLRPATMLSDLRIDLIRNVGKRLDNNHLYYNVKTPYHPLGFDLGNGLFFDLNNNLSIRVDQLFNIAENENYLIKQSQQEDRNIIYKRKNGMELCEERQAAKDQLDRFCKRLQTSAEEDKVYRGDQLLYEINTRTDQIHFISANKEEELNCSIEWKKENQYTIFQKDKQRIFLQQQDMITLGGQLMVHKDSESNKLSIYNIEAGKCQLLYQLKKGDNKIIIYDENYRGIMIELATSKVTVFKDGELAFELERLS